MSENNGPSESKIQKVIFNQVSLVLAISGVLFGIYFTFANPQKNSDMVIATLRSDLHEHEAVQLESDRAIAAQLELIRQGDLKDLKEDLIENRSEITSLRNEIIKLETIISERIPKK
jgi:uncharacterized membrane protein